MKLVISKIKLSNLVDILLRSNFYESGDIMPYMEAGKPKVDICFSATRNKYFRDRNGNVYFSPFHTRQYSIFLYYLANTIYQFERKSPIDCKNLLT